MKIAFAVEEDKGLESTISHRFGRAPYFIIVEIENNEIKNTKTIENPGSKAASGAAIKAVQKLVDENVEMVVAGAFGPNAATALEEMKIKYFQLHGTTIREALEQVVKND
ncbi:MAG: dinitrogenase iron-molybdenum cofactor biosynthesis protein [Thermoprotei archaeon]|nr:MAG: dinitrogenase iron-molybdenum cofactor biosynthesis protein [Thermoprotei archaeon]